MSIDRFLKSLYLGDRFCTKFVIDGVQNQVELHVDLISRVRDESGLIPNDEIYDIYANEIGEGVIEFSIDACHVKEDASTHDILIKVVGENVHLINPLKPDIKIID